MTDEARRLREFDLAEIDAPDQRSHFALKYAGRLEAVLAAVSRSGPPGGTVLEAGCAQANAGLLLAEAGYKVTAVDLLPDALGYALAKHESGAFCPVCANIAALPFASACFDVIYLGEVIEHCARPADVLRGLAHHLKGDGILVITTMNGEWFGSPDPTHSQAASRELSRPEFGRGGEDHLFAFTAVELRRTVEEAGLHLVRMERHATVLHSDKLMALKRFLPPRAIRAVSRLVCRLPYFGRVTALTLLAVATR